MRETEDRCFDFLLIYDIIQNIRLFATFNQYMYFFMKMLSGSIIHNPGYLESHKGEMEFDEVGDTVRTKGRMYYVRGQNFSFKIQ